MKTLAFFRSISFGSFKPWNPKPKKAVVQEKVEEPNGELNSILPITARRPGSQAGFHLLASHLTPQNIIFRTGTPLKEGDPLEIDILLHGVGNVTIMAQVRSIVMASTTRVNSPRDNVTSTVNTMYAGQLELWSTDSQRQDIQNFLRRSAGKSRAIFQ